MEESKENIASVTPQKDTQIDSSPKISIEAAQGIESAAQETPTPDPQNPTEEPNPVVIDASRVSTDSSQAPVDLPKPTNCKECIVYSWKTTFNFFDHDRNYGSLVGSHPPSFLCWCRFCKSCNPKCIRPFTFASFSTKLMYFLMIILIVILSCFFIVPSTSSKYLVDISYFVPCLQRKVNGVWKDCKGQGGYFMVYRNFFALNFYFLCMAFIMIGVKSTTNSKIKKKIHHGFWLYKYLILVMLLFISYFAIRVELGGVFEIIMMWLGLLSTLVFSVVQLVLFLDLLELGLIENQRREKPKRDIVYGIAVTIVSITNLTIFVLLCAFYTISFKPSKIIPYYKNEDMDIGIFKDHFSETQKMPCLINIFCIIYLFALSLIILTLSGLYRKRLPIGSSLQSLCVILYNILLVWSAMENQENFTCRPFWREWFSRRLNPGNKDTYFKFEGFFHGVAALLALYYYVFWHGPRTDTAPLSIAFSRVINRCSKRSMVPALSDNMPTIEHQAAQRKFRTWDDEQLEVTYSWSMFYVFLMLGSMTICAAMTNFSDPWANLPMTSSWPAFAIKITISVVTFGAYLWPLLLPKSRCILPDDDV